MPRGVRVDGGSDWFALARRFAAYAAARPARDQLAAGLTAYWAHALLPSEVRTIHRGHKLAVLAVLVVLRGRAESAGSAGKAGSAESAGI